jgi:hypothetical protein
MILPLHSSWYCFSLFIRHVPDGHFRRAVLFRYHNEISTNNVLKEMKFYDDKPIISVLEPIQQVSPMKINLKISFHAQKLFRLQRGTRQCGVFALYYIKDYLGLMDDEEMISMVWILQHDLWFKSNWKWNLLLEKRQRQAISYCHRPTLSFW